MFARLGSIGNSRRRLDSQVRKKFAAATIAMVCTFSVTACNSTDNGGVGPKESSAGLRAAAAQQITAAVTGRTQRGVEDDFLRIESKVPGFGGFIIRDGVLVAFQKDRSRDAALRSALQGLIAEKRDGVYNPLTETTGIAMRNTRFQIFLRGNRRCLDRSEAFLASSRSMPMKPRTACLSRSRNHPHKPVS